MSTPRKTKRRAINGNYLLMLRIMALDLESIRAFQHIQPVTRGKKKARAK